MKNEVGYGNHRSVAKYGGEMVKIAVTDLAVTQAKETVELWTSSPVGVVEEKEKT